MGCIHHPSCFFLHHVCSDPPKKVTLQNILRECPPKRPPRDFQDSKCTHRLCPFAKQKSPRFRSGSCPDFHKTKVLMVQKSGEKTDMTCMKPVVNHGRNYQSQLAIDGIFPSVNISAKKYLISRTRKNGAKLPTVTFWHGRVPFNSRIYSKRINKKHFTTFQQMIWINLILLLLLLLWDIGAFHYTNFIHI